ETASPARSILAEIELLGSLLAERVAGVLLAAPVAQVVAEVLLLRLDVDGVFLQLFQELADRLHVVFLEIVLGDLGGVVGSENLDLHHVMVLALAKLLAAVIAREVQHVSKTSSDFPSPHRRQGTFLMPGICSRSPREELFAPLSIRRRF